MGKKIFSVLRTITVNILVFLLLLIIVNWACGIYLERAASEKRHNLPNYADNVGYAEEIFNDYHSVGHTYKPFVGWQMLPYQGKTVTINEQGLRSHPVINRNEDSVVVRFFGGSTMWGEGSDDSHTIPALFNKVFPELTVYNHGQLAYNSRQNLDALISVYNQGEEADVVVFYDGVNDAAFLCPADITQLPGHRLVPMFKRKLFGGKKQVALDILNNLFTENIFIVIRQFDTVTGREPSLYDCVDSEKGRLIAEMMLRNWEMAHELVSNRGGTFIAILQPVSFIGSPKLDYLDLDNELGKNFREVYYHLKLMIQQKNYPWIIDMTDAFDGDEYIYIDFCHVSENGNRIIADRLASAFRNQTDSHMELLPVRKPVKLNRLVSNRK